MDDAAPCDVRAVGTPRRDGDGPMLANRLGQALGQVPEGDGIGTAAADGARRPCGAHDARHGHAAIAERGAVRIVAIRRNARP